MSFCVRLLVPLVLLAAPIAMAQDTASGDLAATLRERGDASAFMELVDVVGWDAVLDGDGPFTLFVPTDAAVSRLPDDLRAALAAPEHRDDLIAVLRFHVAPGRLTLEDIGRTARVTSLHGDDLALRQVDDGSYTIDVARLLEHDVPAGHGMLHVLDEVLVPSGLRTADDAARFGGGVHTYTVDLGHSAILFRVIHAEAGAQWGQFRSFAGEVVVDAENPENSSIVLAVDVRSIDTGNTSRDGYLLTGDYFDADTHQGLSFRSTRVVPRGPGRLQVTGTLGLLGVEREVTCLVRKVGESRFGKDMYKIGFETELTIKRSDFGMTMGIPGVAADEVRLIIALECDRPLEAGEGG